MCRFFLVLFIGCVFPICAQGQITHHLLPMTSVISEDPRLLQYEQAIGFHLAAPRSLREETLLARAVVFAEFDSPDFSWRIDKPEPTGRDSVYRLTCQETTIDFWKYCWNGIPLPDTASKGVQVRISKEDALLVEALFHAAILTTVPPKDGYDFVLGEYNSFWYSVMHGQRVATSYSADYRDARGRRLFPVPQLERFVLKIKEELGSYSDHELFCLSPGQKEGIKVLTGMFQEKAAGKRKP